MYSIIDKKIFSQLHPSNRIDFFTTFALHLISSGCARVTKNLQSTKKGNKNCQRLKTGWMASQQPKCYWAGISQSNDSPETDLLPKSQSWARRYLEPKWRKSQHRDLQKKFWANELSQLTPCPIQIQCRQPYCQYLQQKMNIRAGHLQLRVRFAVPNRMWKFGTTNRQSKRNRKFMASSTSEAFI